jgi:hypothetical protein
MFGSVRALLEQVVDYAGLFPPAKLPLDAALATYFREQAQSPYKWMLGKFVCPAKQLAAVPVAVGPGLRVAALGQQAGRAEEFANSLDADFKAIGDFRAISAANVVDSLEAALPAGASLASLGTNLGELANRLGETRLAGFLEVPVSPTWRDDVAQLAQALRGGQSKIGMKLRCGGLAATAFPSDADVAWFIVQCRDAGLPWKATAGLHHPRRHWDEALKVWHHGFLNVFVAGLLSCTHNLGEADLAAILADRSGEHFRFEEGSIAWKNWSCTTAQIRDLRASRVISFGSCSFAEPCDDLRAMGLI